jgi:hypothetical protein
MLDPGLAASSIALYPQDTKFLEYERAIAVIFPLAPGSSQLAVGDPVNRPRRPGVPQGSLRKWTPNHDRKMNNFLEITPCFPVSSGPSG